MAKVIAVCISENKGTVKIPVQKVHLEENYGITGDAHAGTWHRQISLLGVESVNKMKALLPDLPAGAFAENLLVEGLTLYELPVGTKLNVGKCLLEITQIGKECHASCAIRNKTGDCVMPREGIFAKVISGGMIRPGDPVSVCS